MTARKIDPLTLTHRQFRPRFESNPYRQNPGRREFVHGKIIWPDTPERSTFWSLMAVAFAGACFVAPLIMGN